jgi:hypothetical protein
MKPLLAHICRCLFLLLALPAWAQAGDAVVLPMDRTAYFVGEKVPLAVSGEGACKLEAVRVGGRTTLYSGPAGALWLDTSGEIGDGSEFLRHR